MDDAQILELLRKASPPPPPRKRRSIFDLQIGSPIRPRVFWGTIVGIPFIVGLVACFHELLDQYTTRDDPVGACLMMSGLCIGRGLCLVLMAAWNGWRWNGRSRRVLGGGRPVRRSILGMVLAEPACLFLLCASFIGVRRMLSSDQFEIAARSWELVAITFIGALLCILYPISRLRRANKEQAKAPKTRQSPWLEFAWNVLFWACIYVPIKLAAGPLVSCFGMFVACAITLDCLRTLPAIRRSGRRWGSRSRRVLGAVHPVSLLPELSRTLPVFPVYLCVADVSRLWFDESTASQTTLDVVGLFAALFVSYLALGGNPASRRFSRPWRRGQMAHPSWY